MRFSIMHILFFKLPRNFARSLWSYSFFLHLCAIGFTYILISRGFDWFYFQHTRSVVFLWVFLPAIVIGYIVPFLSPLILYIRGKSERNFRKLNAAFALGQATIISFLIFSFFKIIAGRAAPELFHAIGAIDTSREFNFLEGGLVSGWPSGHTAWAFAMAVTLWFLYPESKKIRYFSIVYAIYIGLGMSVTFHWFSDVVAGIFIGLAVGVVVGKCFRNRYSQLKN